MADLLNSISNSYKQNPNKTAVIIDQRAYSYAELTQKVNNSVYELKRLGVKPSDKIIVVLPNGLDFVIALLATAGLNATIVPLALDATADNFRAACINTGASHVIGWHSRLRDFKAIAAGNSLYIDNWLSVGREINDCVSFESLYTETSHAPAVSEEIDVNNPYILTMTSGSTGAPKPIELSQKTKQLRARSAIELYNVTSNDITLIATPLYHSLAERLIFVSLLSGGTAVIMSKFNIDTWLETIQQFKVSFTIAVSSQLKQILTKSNVGDLSSLRCLVSSSALLDLQVKQSLLKILNCEFHECYGASEIAIATNVRFDPSQTNLSVGKAIDNTDIVILSEQLNTLAPGQVGEIACRTPMQFSGYYGQPKNTQNAYHGQYFLTGDLGKLDESGNLFFMGRKKEIIITGGINVYPVDIENVAKQNDAINEVVAFSIPDEHLGESVAVAVAFKPSLGQATEQLAQQLRIDCATKLSGQQQPRKLFVFESLPKNAMGKINKLKLQELARNVDTSKHWLINMEAILND